MVSIVNLLNTGRRKITERSYHVVGWDTRWSSPKISLSSGSKAGPCN